MPLRTSWQPDETAGGDAPTRKVMPARLAKVKSIEATARILRPTRSSLARTTTKRLSGTAKAKADARTVERKRRLLTRVTKENGRLTIPKSPKFQSQQSTRKSVVSKLTMTSRELVEIDAIKKRVQEMKKKTQKYHEATTRSVLSSTSSSSGSSTKASFAMVSIAVFIYYLIERAVHLNVNYTILLSVA